MMYDARHVYINGEAYRTAGRDARLMRHLCDRRRLAAAEISGLSPQARVLLDEWALAGWVRSARCKENEDERGDDATLNRTIRNRRTKPPRIAS